MMTTFTENDNRPKMTKLSESDKSPIRILSLRAVKLMFICSLWTLIKEVIH